MCEVTPAFPLHASANLFPGWVERGGGGGGGGGEGRVSIWGAFGDVYVYIHTHISYSFRHNSNASKELRDNYWSASRITCTHCVLH